MVTDFVTYLSFDGRCEEAFKRYEKVFRGKILMMMRHSDAPPGSGVPQNPETANRIMHARLEVGGRLLMGGDAPAHSSSKPQGFCVSVAVDDPAEAERIFGQLSEGGAIVMPIGETFWAQRFGMVTWLLFQINVARRSSNRFAPTILLEEHLHGQTRPGDGNHTVRRQVCAPQDSVGARSRAQPRRARNRHSSRRARLQSLDVAGRRGAASLQTVRLRLVRTVARRTGEEATVIKF